MACKTPGFKIEEHIFNYFPIHKHVAFLGKSKTDLDYYLSFVPQNKAGVNNAMMWITLFWIIMLFASINAIVKSFVQENGNRQLYYYSLLDPLAVIISKMVYNISLLFLLSLLTWAALAFMVGNQIEEFSAFLLALFLGSVGFSILFTFVAAISSKADNNSTLLAILSFPLVIPILMTLIKLSVGATGMLEDTGVGKDIGILVAIDLVLAGLTLVLYPFLWRD